MIVKQICLRLSNSFTSNQDCYTIYHINKKGDVAHEIRVQIFITAQLSEMISIPSLKNFAKDLVEEETDETRRKA